MLKQSEELRLSADSGCKPSLRAAPPQVSTPVPWHIWECVFAAICGGIGSIWDISWHKSIGRDTFWTAPHIFIYLSGIVAGLSCGYVILSTTFGRDSAARAVSVKLWGFRGPLGAFICSWGGIAMIASAPFDNWWHNAYGLDVKVLSPPHVVLMLGMVAIRFGTLLLLFGQLSRARGAGRTTLHAMLLYIFMSLMAISLGMFQEFTIRPNMHSAVFYIVVASAIPLWLAALSAASSGRWACTAVTAMYTFYYIACIWILPVFPAEPKLGPVYQAVTRFVPPDFPILLIVPAFLIDLLRPRFADWSKWRQAAATGVLFLGSLAAAQWPFANFLQSTASGNWFFGTHYIPYFVPPNTDYARHVFTQLDGSAREFWLKMGLALAVAVVMTRAGLSWGASLRKLRR